MNNEKEIKYFGLYSVCWLFKVEKLFRSISKLRNFSMMNIGEFGRIYTPANPCGVSTEVAVLANCLKNLRQNISPFPSTLGI